ncbi:unnamed protein product [Cylicocyclus nassatus]|uniref:Major sperm protein n=1 Tax=Cylicocyclus nassatus TaxID=53992 RepID=A0AA36GJG1_CYLNA|nr:unnamed protein product [Cylicocyclus nassatus]
MQSTSPIHHRSSRYVPLRTTPHASGSLSTEEIFLLASMCAFAAFNIHDAENSNFFDILTIVPGAVFTFKCMVMNGDRSFVAMCLVTGYWLFFTLAIFNGYMYEKEESYLSIRLMLLGALGAKAYQKVWNKKSSIEKVDTGIASPASVITSSVRSPKSEFYFGAARQPEYSLQQQIETADLESPVDRKIINNMNSSKNITPKKTKDSIFDFKKNSTIISESELLLTSKELSTTTASLSESVTPSTHTNSTSFYTKSMSATQNRTVTTTLTDIAGKLRTGVPACSEKLTSRRKLYTATRPTDRTRRTTERLQTAKKVEQKRNNHVVVSYGDIITNPMNTLKFPKKESTRKLTVTNITESTIMWALKASSAHSFNAIPAHGILHPGTQQETIVSLDPQLNLSQTGRSTKVAIDYAFVKSNVRCFEKNLFNTCAKRRHILQAVLSS